MTEEELQLLLSLARQPAPPDERFVDASSVDQWILANNITAGMERITPTRAFVAYKRWAKQPINQHDFFKQLKRRFKRQKATVTKDGDKAHFVYLLCPDPFVTVPKDFKDLMAELAAAKDRK